MEKILDEFIRQTPTLTNATRRVSREGERTAVEFQASFKSALDLMNAVRGDSVLASGNLKSTVPPLIGHFDFQRSGLTVELTRTVQPAQALQRRAAIVPGMRKIRRQGDGLLIT